MRCSSVLLFVVAMLLSSGVECKLPALGKKQTTKESLRKIKPKTKHKRTKQIVVIFVVCQPKRCQIFSSLSCTRPTAKSASIR